VNEMSAYRDLFAEESEEYLGVLESRLAVLAHDPDDRMTAEEIFRAAHTLKGMCSAMGFDRSAELAARMERLAHSVNTGDAVVTPALIGALGEATSAMRPLIGADMNSQTPPDMPWPDLDPDRYGAYHAMPSAAGLAARDIAHAIVRVDVTLEESCVLKALRAHVVIKRLSELGEITGSEPTLTRLEEERFERAFSVTIRTDRSLQDIIDSIGEIDEVSELSVEQLLVSESASTPERLTPLQIDALREVGNIGAGHAATALSEILGRRFSLSPPVLQTVLAGEVSFAFGIAKTLVGATCARVSGDMHGAVLIIATCDTLLELCDIAEGRAPGATRLFGAAEEALVVKAGTILAEKYVGAISQLAGLDARLEHAVFELDFAGTILQEATAKVTGGAPWAALVRTTLSAEGQSFDVAVVFVPEQESLSVLFERLGVA